MKTDYGYKVLVMDDEEMIQECLEMLLEDMGYRVDIACNGCEAVELYRDSLRQGMGYDAVILDLNVPGGSDGLEAMSSLLKLDPGVAGIASSGNSLHPVMMEPHKHGFVSTIAKPFSIEDVGRILNAVLERNQFIC